LQSLQVLLKIFLFSLDLKTSLKHENGVIVYIVSLNSMTISSVDFF